MRNISTSPSGTPMFRWILSGKRGQTPFWHLMGYAVGLNQGCFVALVRTFQILRDQYGVAPLVGTLQAD